MKPIDEEIEDFWKDFREELAAKDAERSPIYSTTPRIREARFDVPKLPKPKDYHKPYNPPEVCCYVSWLNGSPLTLSVLLSGFNSVGCVNHVGVDDTIYSTNSEISDINTLYTFEIDPTNCTFYFAQTIGSFTVTSYSEAGCAGDVTGVGSGGLDMIVQFIAGEDLPADTTHILVTITTHEGDTPIQVTRYSFFCSSGAQDGSANEFAWGRPLYTPGSVTLGSI